MGRSVASRSCKYTDFGGAGKIDIINAVIFLLHVNDVLRVLTADILKCETAFMFKMFCVDEKK